MKTIFFSAVEITEEKIIGDENIKTENISFNTEKIMTPHDVLSAIKVSIRYIMKISDNHISFKKPNKSHFLVCFNSLFQALAPDNSHGNDMTIIGFVGYPNVGKSSVINIFMENKRLQVSATPGKVCIMVINRYVRTTLSLV